MWNNYDCKTPLAHVVCKAANMIDADCGTEIGVSSPAEVLDKFPADNLDTHEGAEAPFVGAVAAFGGLMTSLGTDTHDFSERLKKRPRGKDVEAMSRILSNDEPSEVSLKKGITSKQFHHLAFRMAAKSYEENPAHNFRKPHIRPGLKVLRDKVAAKKAKGGRGYQITSATAHYACDLAATGAKGEPARVYHDRLLTI